jgi:hypothetical protein
MKRILGESLKLFSHWRWRTKNIKRCTFLLVFSNNTILFKVSSVTPQQLNNTIGRRWYFGNEGMNFVNKESKWIKRWFCAGGGQVGMSFFSLVAQMKLPSMKNLDSDQRGSIWLWKICMKISNEDREINIYYKNKNKNDTFCPWECQNCGVFVLVKHDSFVLSILWQQVKDSLFYIFLFQPLVFWNYW